MAFSEKLLAQGEHVELELRAHLKRVVLPLLIGLLTIIGAALLLWVINGEDLPSWFSWVIIGLAVIELVVLVLLPILRWRTTIYVITNRRLITREGIMTRTGRDIPLYRINDVTYEKDALDRMLGCGTLIISDATDKAGVKLTDIPRVEQVHVRLNELLFQSDSTDGPTPPTLP